MYILLISDKRIPKRFNRYKSCVAKIKVMKYNKVNAWWRGWFFILQYIEQCKIPSEKIIKKFSYFSTICNQDKIQSSKKISSTTFFSNKTLIYNILQKKNFSIKFSLVFSLKELVLESFHWPLILLNDENITVNRNI